MARKKRRYRKRSGFKLKNDTIYTLSAIGMIFTGFLLLFSYSRSGEALILINQYLVYYFGLLSFLIPICLILLAMILTKIRVGFAKVNVVVGFLTLTGALIGLFRSGFVGEQANFQISSIIGTPLTVLFFIAAVFISLIVMFNVSLNTIFEFFRVTFGGAIVNIAGVIANLLKSKKNAAIQDLQPIRIKGMKDQNATTAMAQNIQGSKQGVAGLKKDGLSAELILNKPLEIGVWEFPPLSLLSEHHDKKAERGDVKKVAATIEKTLQSFGVQARVVEINLGPSVTQYAIEIALGTKLSKITGLANDLALATEAISPIQEN